MNPRRVDLVVGGCRSGKSNYALALAEARAAETQKAFIATAEARDEEMKARIAKHQQDRGKRYLTVEEPINLARAIRSLPPQIDVAIVDCLTVWLGNLMLNQRVRGEINTSHRGGRGARLARHEEGEYIDVFNRRVTPPGCDGSAPECSSYFSAGPSPEQGEHSEITSFLELISEPGTDLILVSNEVGFGPPPQNDLARRFREHAGTLNLTIGHLAARIILMVCGIPVIIKPKNR